MRQIFFAAALLLTGCTTLPRWVENQERNSWELLQQNISPQEPKSPGGPKPRAGIVVAALHKKDPDYYFHWVRDSANVMRVVAEYDPDAKRVHARMRDFLDLSRDLQLLHSPYGMGEPRYTVEGKVDQLPWSRPQYDGPALRALAIQSYLKRSDIPAESRALALQVLRRDLDFVEQVHTVNGFDLWEELKAENYHTRVVQMAALENDGRKKAAADLERRLEAHWDAKKNYYRSQLSIERTDGYTKKNTDLDSAVVVAVIEGGRMTGRHSPLDPRVQATVAALENLFESAYPINEDRSLGLGYGRYQGDVYYGGNPWYLITAYYAQFYYRLARGLSEANLIVTPENRGFVDHLLPQWTSQSATRREWMAACVKKADRILARLRSVTPKDGQLYEQFDKSDGRPVSSRGIGWAHAAFLAASLERKLVVPKD